MDFAFIYNQINNFKIFSLERRTFFCALKKRLTEICFFYATKTYVFDRILLKLFSKSKCVSNLIQFNQYMHKRLVSFSSDQGLHCLAYRMLLKVIKFE